MIMNWRKNVTAAMITASIVLTIQPIQASKISAAPSSAIEAGYPLTNSIQAEVKSVVNELTTEGTRIGTVIRLYNQGSRTVGIPDYEIRVKTEEGVEYVIPPSAANVSTIQPKEEVELSYLALLDSNENMTLSELSWVEIDEYVYPKLETKKLSVPISSIVWQGSSVASQEQNNVKQWGESFVIPVLSPSLLYTTVNLVPQVSAQGSSAVAVLMVENTGTRNEAVPDLQIEGRTDTKGYAGAKVEHGKAVLGPGEKQYLHYAIPMDTQGILKRLSILAEKTFVDANKKTTAYSTGGVDVRLPEAVGSASYAGAFPAYQLKDLIPFDPLNKLVKPELDVSMVELHMLESGTEGYKTINAKFKLRNNSEQPLPVPGLKTELVSEDGKSYTGTQLGTVNEMLLPKLGYVCNYVFIVPNTEKGDRLGFRISDNVTTAPFSIPIASFATKVESGASDDVISIYPYNIKVKSASAKSSLNFSGGHFLYSYRVLLDTSIIFQDTVVADQAISKMKVELLTKAGKLLGEQVLTIGDSNYLNGEHAIDFKNTDEYDFSLVLNFYEVVQTPFGEAKRFVKMLRI